MKKFLSVLLLVMMIMSLLVVSAFATEGVRASDETIDIPIDGDEGDPGVVPPVTQTHTHCICGGCAEGVKDHVCDETAVWSPISGNVDFGTLASGNYYLEGDVTVSACTSIKQDVQLNICLNGNDISGTKAIFGYAKAGSVISITDCSGQQGADGTWTWGGTITGTNVPRGSVVCGGIFYLQSGATVNIYGGNLTATGTYKYGAIAYMQEEAKVDGYAVYPTFNVYNGRLYNTEGASAERGGLISALSASAINLYGGTVEGGVATDRGGNIYTAAAKDSTGTHRDVVIEGGTVTGGTAVNGGNIDSAARVYIRNGGTVSDGTASTNGGNIYARWNLNLYDGGVISGGKAGKGGGNAMSTTGCNINIYGGQVLGGEAAYGGSLYTYQGVIKIDAGLVSGGVSTGNGGNIAVEGTSTKSATLTISGGTVQNGQGKGGNIALVNSYTSGTISGGTISGGVGVGQHGGNILVSGGKLTMTGGELIGTTTKQSAANLYATGAYNIQLKAGLISGGQNEWQWNGGSIRLAGSTGTFVIGVEGAEDGPTITGGYARQAKGGNIYCDSGTVTIHSGTVTGGKGSSFNASYQSMGGNIYTKNLVMTGGTISDGIAYGKWIAATETTPGAMYGGWGSNVYVTASMEMTGGTISGGTHEGGGSVYIASGAIANITGGTITGGNNILTSGPADFGNGGNFYVAAGGTLNLTGTTVSDGQAAKRGGNIYTLGTVTVNGGTISGGTATTSLGGSIAIGEGGSVTVTGATVSGGSAEGESAGNFFVAKDAALTLINSTVTGGSAYSGGNIFCQGGSLTISGCQITDGYARKNGGNINVANGSTFSLENTTVSGGSTNTERTDKTMTYGGNIFYAGNLAIGEGVVISGGTANTGGNIYAYSINMTGGEITGGQAIKSETANAGGNGGNAYVDGNSATTISGGTIADGYADTNGGNIYSRDITVSGGTIANGESLKGGGNIQLNGDFTATVTGEAVIEGGKSRYGANIYTYGGTVVVEGGTIQNGTAVVYGGNIACEYQNDNNPGIFQMSGGTVSGGKVTNLYTGSYQGGGNIWAWDFTMSGGTIADGWSRQNGGNVRAQNSAIMTGGEITGGHAENFGGNMWASNLDMTGGTISGGYAKQVGGSLCISTLFTAKNVTISGGESATSGGNVWGKYLDWDNVTLTGGKAANKGANLFIGEQNAELVDMPRIIKNCQILDGVCTDTSSYGGGVAIKLGTITIQDTVIADSAEDLAGCGRCIYVEGVGAMTLQNVTLTNNTGKGTTIWNEGTLTLVGNLTINGNDTLDLMIDARINPDAAVQIGEYTGTNLMLVRRWEKDAINDDAGVIAKGAVAADLDKFMAWTNGYFVEYIEVTIENEDGTTATEGQIVLSDFAIHAMDAEGKPITGFTTVEEWMADTQGVWYTLNRDFDGAIINKSMLLDLNGHNLTNLILGEGVELTIIDTTTDDYDCENGYGTVTLDAANMGTVTTGNIKTTAEQIGAVKSYMILVEDGVYSAHRYYAGITKVTLRTGNKGFGYKAQFAGDQKVQEQIERFGFRLWLGDSTNVVVRSLDMSKFDSEKEWTLLLRDFDIIGKGEVAVNAEVFMTLKAGGEIASSTVSYSMKTMLQKINENLESFTAEQIQAIREMFTAEELAVVSQWGIDALLPQITETPEDENTEG